jgi:hypothetical protein
MRVVDLLCHPVMPDVCIFGPEMKTGEEYLLTRLAS